MNSLVDWTGLSNKSLRPRQKWKAKRKKATLSRRAENRVFRSYGHLQKCPRVMGYKDKELGEALQRLSPYEPDTTECVFVWMPDMAESVSTWTSDNRVSMYAWHSRVSPCEHQPWQSVSPREPQTTQRASPHEHQTVESLHISIRHVRVSPHKGQDSNTTESPH